MPAQIVQAEYDQLQEVADRFATRSEATEQMTATLRQMAEILSSGSWTGRGVDAFTAEMRGDVFPAMQRLHEALQQGSVATIEISQFIRSAEEEAAALFATAPGPNGTARNGAAGSGTNGNTGGGPSGTGTGGTSPSPKNDGGTGVAKGSELGGNPLNQENRPGWIPDSIPNARELYDSEGRWIRNPETGEWQRTTLPEGEKDWLQENNVKVEAVLYQQELAWAKHEGSVWGDEWEGSYGRLEVDALGYETDGELKIVANASDGLVASGSLSGEAYLGRAEYNGTFGPEYANVEANGEVLAGGQAKVEGQVVFDPLDGEIYAGAGGEAFIGVTASGEIKGNVGDYGSVGAEGKVGAGLGVEGNIDVGIQDGVVALDVDVGAYLGLGLSGGFSVEIDAREIYGDVTGGLQSAGGWIAGKFGW